MGNILLNMVRGQRTQRPALRGGLGTSTENSAPSTLHRGLSTQHPRSAPLPSLALSSRARCWSRKTPPEGASAVLGGEREARPPRGEFSNGWRIPRWTRTRSTVEDVWIFKTQPRCPQPVSPRPSATPAPGLRPQPPLASPLSPRGGGGLESARGEGAGKETPADPCFSFLKNS